MKKKFFFSTGIILIACALMLIVPTIHAKVKTLTGWSEGLLLGIVVAGGWTGIVLLLHWYDLFMSTADASFKKGIDGTLEVLIRIDKERGGNKILDDFLAFLDREKIEKVILDHNSLPKKVYGFSFDPAKTECIARWMNRHRVEINDPEELIN